MTPPRPIVTFDGRARASLGPATFSPMADERERTRAKLTTVFGWVAGGTLGVLANWGLYVAVGEGYPVTWTTFALFLGGAFGGMYLGDRFGERAFRPLGIAAGVLFAVFLGVVLTVTLSPTP